MLNRKTTINLLIIGLINKIPLYKMSYFPEPYICSKSKIKGELDLASHATKSDLNMKQVLIHQNLIKRLI